MSIHTEELREVSGFDKEIEASALGMIFDNLQVYQYQYPERSTIRELVSNALDSVKERQIAQDILKGQAREEDYYLRRDDAVYKASNFDASYYNLDYLSSENYVRVDYYEGAESERDRVEITDYGVGLGGDRLRGYFKLGYSSKRNTKFALGKFGIGAKAALSTGVDCYYVESRYNGLLTKWNVYSAKINSLVPRLNLQSGQENVLLPFGEAEVYAERQEGHNYTKIVIAVKKHKKQVYLDAVKSQLMYFRNVQLRLHKNDGSGFSELIPTQAQIIFENEHLVVAKNTIYNKPHIILNGVNYGLIDFKELELEDKHGNVGIKVPAEGVIVNPSRESVIWNDKTRETILHSFELAVDAASKIVGDRLQTTDYWEWHRTLEQAKGRLYNSENDSDALGVLTRIIDVEKIDFSFKPDPRLGGSDRALWGIQYMMYGLEVKEEKVGKKTIRKTKLVRDEREYLPSLDPDVAIVFLKGDDIRPYVRTLRYMLTSPDIKRIMVFRQQAVEFNPLKPEEFLAAGTKLKDLTFYRGVHWFTEACKDRFLKRFLRKGRELNDFAEIQASVFEQIKASKRTKILEDVVVPEDFKFNLNQVDEEIVEEEVIEPEKPKSLTPDQIRKAQGRVFMRTPRFTGGEVELHGVEPNLLEMDEWKDTYYATADNSSQLMIAAALSVNVHNDYIKTAPNTPDGKLAYADGKHLTSVAWGARPNTNYNVVIPNKEDLTASELERMEKEVNILYSQFNQNVPYYYSPSMDGSRTPDSFKQPVLRLIIVAKDLARKLPDNVRPIREFFLSFTSNQEITMSNILANWYLASLIQSTLDECEDFTDNGYFDNVRIKSIARELRVFVNKWGRTSLLSMLKEQDQQSLEQVTLFMEKVLKFQQFVSLHHTEPDLIAAQAKHLFGNDGIKGAVAFDMDVYNKIAELQEFYNQAGFFLAKIDWDQMDQKSADLVREIGQYKGWEPWEFEAPYPTSTPDDTSNSTPDNETTLPF